MKRFLFSILLIGVWNCSLDEKDAEFDFEDLIKIENEFIYKMRNNDRPSGKVYMILNNGEKKYIGKLSNGIPYGDWSKLNTKGDVIERTNFTNGIPGRKYVIIYYDNGQKHIEGSYLHNNKNGLFMMYYKNGLKSFRGEYLDGSGVGFWSYFDENGKMIKKIDCSIENCN